MAYLTCHLETCNFILFSAVVNKNDPILKIYEILRVKTITGPFEMEII
jgi:hypothetical protein